MKTQYMEFREVPAHVPCNPRAAHVNVAIQSPSTAKYFVMSNHQLYWICRPNVGAAG